METRRRNFSRRKHDEIERLFSTLNDSQREKVEIIRDILPEFPIRRALILKHLDGDLPAAPKLPENIAKMAVTR